MRGKRKTQLSILLVLAVVIALVSAGFVLVSPMGEFFKVSAPTGRTASPASPPAQEPVLQPELTLSTERIYYFTEEEVNLTDPPSLEMKANSLFSTNSKTDQEHDIHYVEGFNTPFVPQREPEYNGYIIQFKEDPITKGGSRYEIEKQQSIALENFREIIPDIESRELERYSVVLNGIALAISDKEVEEFEKSSLVKSVHKNYKVKTTLQDSVPLIQADKVWLLKDSQGNNITGLDRTIAIIDTGINYTHPDLGGCFGPGCKVEAGWDFVNNDSDPMDDHYHGTHCAGIAAANGFLKGVAPEAKLHAYKVLDSGGGGWDSDVIAGIERATDPNQDGNTSDHVDVISLSLGTSAFYFDDCYEVGSSIASDNAVKAGVFVSVSAGNSYNQMTIGAPACAKKVVTVGASDKQDKMASFSSKGPTKDLRVKPDVVAPGLYINSTYIEGGYIEKSGTSMSAPHVAGLGALVIQKHPGWSPKEIKHAMRNTALDLGEEILTQGYGRINALDAVQSETPPIAELNTSGIQKDVINITGEVSANDFKNYKIEYTELPGPANWKLLYETNIHPKNNILYENWDTTTFNDSLFLFKLTVSTTDNMSSEDHNLIGVINNPEELYCSSCFECNLYATIKDAHIYLKKDIEAVTNCIVINADNIVFDGMGHKINIEFVNGPYASAVYVPFVNNFTLVNTTLTHPLNALDLYFSDYLKIYNNTIIDTGEGIHIWGCIKPILKNNKMFNCKTGLFVAGPPYDCDIDTSNTIDGIPIYYFNKADNSIIENLKTKHLQITQSNNVTVRNNIVSEGDGMSLNNMENSLIENNYISLNTGGHGGYTSGIFMDKSKNNKIINNTILNNSWANLQLGVITKNNYVANNYIDGCHPDSNCMGIRLFEPKDSTLFSNDVRNNWIGIYYDWAIHINTTENHLFNNDYPLYITGSGKNPEEYNQTIYHNTFIEDSPFVTSLEPIEIYHNREGNFWNRTSPPYFIPGKDSNLFDVKDSCPYGKAYPPGQWPESPVCPDAPKSMINNPTPLDVKGNLNMEVQKLESGNWVTDTVIVSNMPLNVPAKGYQAIDTIWNPIGYKPAEEGKYRAFAEFATGGKSLTSSYEFDVYQVGNGSGGGGNMCRIVIKENTVLQEDLINCIDDGVYILYDNLILDCDSHMIDGTWNGHGIRIFGNNVVIKNCMIKEFNIGIDTQYLNQQILNNTISDNSYGIYVSSNSLNDRISENKLKNNHFALTFYDSENNSVWKNVFKGSVEGIKLWYTNKSRLWNNTFENNSKSAEEYKSFSNSWNLSTQGNWWDDWSLNPGYPHNYTIPGDGDGIDYHPDGV
jgi:parallel beta-helix repeat protein